MCIYSLFKITWRDWGKHQLKKVLTITNKVLYCVMKMVLALILASFAARTKAADKISDPAVKAFAKRLAAYESRNALGRIL